MNGISQKKGKKQYLKDLKNHQTKTARIQGLKKLVTLGLRTPWPIKVIIHQGFKDYCQLGSLPEELKRQILTAFNTIRAKNPDRGVYAGRAYYVPGIDNPPGPRSSSVRSQKVILKEVEKLFQFAIANKFDKKPGAEIGVIFYPFINAGDPIPDKNQPKLQFPGGCVTPGDGKLAVIEALFGADEGVQSFSHDTYTVDLSKMEIVFKNIEHKIKSLRATNELLYETIEVPTKYRDQQALTDKVIVDIAHNFKKLVKRFGPHRVEYILQPEGVIFRECIPFIFKDQTVVSAKGKVTVIKTINDVSRLKKIIKIAFVHPTVITNRKMDLLTELAFGVHQKMVILFPGSASTAHVATLLRERGHTIVYVDQKIFKSGEMVIIREGRVVKK